MWVVTYVKASQDVNGNPRRGWFCRLAGAPVDHWVEEGCFGEQSFTNWASQDEVLFLSDRFFRNLELEVTVKEYKRLWSIATERH
jgi:hypothetical protein